MDYLKLSVNKFVLQPISQTLLINLILFGKKSLSIITLLLMQSGE